MNKLNILFKLTKVDEATRTVEGIATADAPDISGEICDYETTKPLYEKWSNGIKKATGGKSLGNVREMHSNIAAGKVTGIEFDDDQKVIRVVTKCVDDSTWGKILEGVLTGFSQGGAYIKKWKDSDTGLVRYTADPSEISYVDRPCLPTATFDVVKADGSVEVRKFQTKEHNIMTVEQVWKASDGSTHSKKSYAMTRNAEIEAELEKREFSQEERDKHAESGAAMEDGSFPIVTETDLENAVHAYGRAKDKEKAKSHIISRAKSLGATDKLPADWKGSTKNDNAEKSEKIGDLAKSCEIWDVSMALEALIAIEWLIETEGMEAADGEDEAGQVSDLKIVIERLKSFISSEIMEGTRMDGTLERMIGAIALIKSMPAEHVDHLKKVHALALDIKDHAHKVMNGDVGKDHMEKIHSKAGDIAEKCVKMFVSPDGKSDTDDEAKKAAEASELAKREHDAVAMKAKIDALTKRLAAIEAQPLPPKGNISVVEKGHEIAGNVTRVSVETETRSAFDMQGVSPADLRAMRRNS